MKYKKLITVAFLQLRHWSKNEIFGMDFAQ